MGAVSSAGARPSTVLGWPLSLARMSPQTTRHLWRGSTPRSRSRVPGPTTGIVPGFKFSSQGSAVRDARRSPRGCTCGAARTSASRQAPYSQSSRSASFALRLVGARAISHTAQAPAPRGAIQATACSSWEVHIPRNARSEYRLLQLHLDQIVTQAAQDASAQHWQHAAPPRLPLLPSFQAIANSSRRWLKGDILRGKCHHLSWTRLYASPRNLRLHEVNIVGFCRRSRQLLFEYCCAHVPSLQVAGTTMYALQWSRVSQAQAVDPRQSVRLRP